MPESQSQRRPIDAVLPGFELDLLPQGWTPLDGVFLIKCLNPEGKALWSLRFTDGINEHELLGALLLQTDMLRKDMLADWADDDEDV